MQAQNDKTAPNGAGRTSHAITIDADKEPERVDALFATMAVKPKRNAKADTNGAQSR